MFDFILYLKVFLVGGTICVLAQILIIQTKMTSARILVLFVTLGVVLQAFNIYQPLIDFADSGATVPIIGFGKSLAEGAIIGAREQGLLGVLVGGLKATAGGIAAAIFFAYFFALFFNARTKRE